MGSERNACCLIPLGHTETRFWESKNTSSFSPTLEVLHILANIIELALIFNINGPISLKGPLYYSTMCTNVMSTLGDLIFYPGSWLGFPLVGMNKVNVVYLYAVYRSTLERWVKRYLNIFALVPPICLVMQC